ncbi:MAG: ABC transporter ATP-binding protein, partial [Anaerolineae bacterium]
AKHLALVATGLVKRFGDLAAVSDISFEVSAGEVFGLLGPNGAGKTTTIRMIMDIFRPDEGGVRLVGLPPAAARERVGYLPEERGLYPSFGVLDTLVYFAQLKGLSRAEADSGALAWLERVGLSEWAANAVQDLSRGMRQKLQFAASLVHDPDVAILDEPFQGLDPVNVEAVKGRIRDLATGGAAVVLSAHQMNLVEALCDRILLIHRGRSVLHGSLAEIKKSYASRRVRLRIEGPLPEIPGVAAVAARDGALTLTLAEATAQDVLRFLLDQGVTVLAFEVASAPLEDIFLEVVGASGADASAVLSNPGAGEAVATEGAQGA